jgi:transposase
VAGEDAPCKGRNRHIAVDTLGLPIKCQVTTADVRDRDALPALLKAVSQKSLRLKLVFVDGGYAGDERQRAAYAARRIRLTVVKRMDREVKGFIVLAKRRIVERIFGWVRGRRHAKDFKALDHLVPSLVHAAAGFPAHPQDRREL